MCSTQKTAHTTKEDLSVLSWARAVLAPLDAMGIHYHILTRFGQHGDSSHHLSPVAPALIFCPPLGKHDLNSLEAWCVCSAITHSSMDIREVISVYTLSLSPVRVPQPTCPVEDAQLVGGSFLS